MCLSFTATAADGRPCAPPLLRSHVHGRADACVHLAVVVPALGEAEAAEAAAAEGTRGGGHESVGGMPERERTTCGHWGYIRDYLRSEGVGSGQAPPPCDSFPGPATPVAPQPLPFTS